MTLPLSRQLVERAESKLGLSGQPRAIVFHEKEGRRHAHCVWSRIDAGSMTARPMSFFKSRLTGLSRDLYLDHGWDMPRGLARAGAKDPLNFTLSEWQQAKRRGQDPRWLKAAVQSAWAASDSAPAFGRALEEHGFTLARGDKRGHVVLDHDGEVHALARLLSKKTKEVRDRLGEPDGLPSVEQSQAKRAERMTPALRRHVEASRDRFRDESAKLGERKAQLTKRHREARVEQQARQQRDWAAETKARAAKLPKGLAGLWHRITGQYQDTRRANEAAAVESKARQAAERQQLIDRQRDERAPLQAAFKDLRARQAAELLELRRELGRFAKLSRSLDAAKAARMEQRRGLTRSPGFGLKLER
ncbi:relaxase/mobilization nuclease domain-containing protein [Methylobacterium komagatae]